MYMDISNAHFFVNNRMPGNVEDLGGSLSQLLELVNTLSLIVTRCRQI